MMERQFDLNSESQFGMVNHRKLFEKNTERSIVAVMLFVAVFFTVTFMHMASWRQHSTTAPVLQVQRILGQLSFQGHSDLVQMCLELGKITCAESVSAERYNVSKNIEALQMHGEVLALLNQKEKAIKAYETYFSADGKSAQAALRFGRLLELSNREQDAIKYYEIAMGSWDSSSLPVQATAGLVRLLIKGGDYKKALAHITTFHALSANAAGYLNIELEQAQDMLKKLSGSKSSKS